MAGPLDAFLPQGSFSVVWVGSGAKLEAGGFSWQ